MSTVNDELGARPARNGEGGRREAVVAAARRLVEANNRTFTTQELIKEAGIALQTFYRHFESKDQLLLAVITDLIAENCELFAARSADMDDPVERLRDYVATALGALQRDAGGLGATFVTAEHWRLQQLYPHEMAEAVKPFADLVQRELESAEEAGLLAPADPERDAWLITTLVTSVYHEYSFLPDDPRIERLPEEVWEFCLAAVGGRSTEPQRRRFALRKR